MDGKDLADAVGVTMGQGENEVIVHMAVIDKDERDQVIQREGSGHPVTIESFDSLDGKFSSSIFKINLLK